MSLLKRAGEIEQEHETAERISIHAAKTETQVFELSKRLSNAIDEVGRLNTLRALDKIQFGASEKLLATYKDALKRSNLKLASITFALEQLRQMDINEVLCGKP